MSRLDDAIANTAYILDCLRLLRLITDAGNCNECGKSKSCIAKPEVGQMVVYNCPFYEQKGKADADH